jgi:endonuclease YncB( thermonuclease family)
MRDYSTFCWATACALALLPTWALAQTLEGQARVIDGDTIVIGDTHIRFHGSDAPESDQTCFNASGELYVCGAVATKALRNLIGNQEVRCIGTGLDRYSRTLASCTVAGTDIERWMVRQGYSVAYSYFSHDYEGDQAAARSEHIGVWAGKFVQPYLWRREHPHVPHFDHPSYGYPR